MTLESSLADDLQMLALILVQQDDDAALVAVVLTAMAGALCG